LREKLRQRDRADLDLRFKALREAQGAEAGQEAFEETPGLRERLSRAFLKPSEYVSRRI
jgi:hypothetical protein